METLMGEKHKFFFLFSLFNLFHIFVGTNILDAPTPKMWKKLLPIGYNLIKAQNSKMCRESLAIDYNLINAPFLEKINL